MTIRPFVETDLTRPGGAIRRLIGLELRLRAPSGQQEEVAIFPLDIELPPIHNFAYPGLRFNVTVHTTYGDATSLDTDLPRG